MIASELNDVGAGNIRPGELERAKENMKGRLLLSLESTSARMTRIGKATVTGVEIVPIDETETAHRSRHGRGGEPAGVRSLRTGVPLGSRNRAEREALPGRCRTVQSRRAERAA